MSDFEFKLGVIDVLLRKFKSIWIEQLKEKLHPIIIKNEISKFMFGLVGSIKILVNLDIKNKNISEKILSILNKINFRDMGIFDQANIIYFSEGCTEYFKIASSFYLSKLIEYIDECQTFLYHVITSIVT